MMILISTAGLGPSFEHPAWGSRRLWSLWDMLRLETGNVLASFSYLGGMIKYLQLGRTQLLRENALRENTSSMRIETSAYAHGLKAVRELRAAAQAMGMIAARSAAARAEETLTKRYTHTDAYDLDGLSALIDALNPLLASFADEAEARVVVSLSQRHAALYSPGAPIFGDEVELAFPRASEDIGEAGKCLAVEQPTAAVFHLMRAMEHAVQALSAELNISKLEREWGKLLSDIGSKIEGMPRSELRDQWSQAHSLLYHVKQAWRNNTMHPKQTYTMEEASAIFDAARSFMSHLATLISRMDASDPPVA